MLSFLLFRIVILGVHYLCVHIQVELLRESHPGVPILSRAKSQRQLYKLFQTGAAEVVPEHTEVSYGLSVEGLRLYEC